MRVIKFLYSHMFVKTVSEAAKTVATALFNKDLKDLTLLSTVVAPSFSGGVLHTYPLSNDQLKECLSLVKDNYMGHPVTSQLLSAHCPTLPASEKKFWDGTSVGVAVRPRGGVRNAAAEGDTDVNSLDQVESVLVFWYPHLEEQQDIVGDIAAKW